MNGSAHNNPQYISQRQGQQDLQQFLKQKIGDWKKGQMQMGEPLTDLHVEDPLTIIREDKLGLQNLTVDEKEGCRDCPWKHYCAGGCPLETYRATGRYDVKSPNCAIYRAIFPEVLRVEGLRLIRQAEKQAVAVR